MRYLTKKASFMIAFTLVAGYGIYLSQKEVELSELALENIEALANAEGSGYSCSATAKCFYAGREEGSVSCTGTKSCRSCYEYVVCDGITSYCW